MTGETTPLLRTLAAQVQARDPEAQMATIQRIGLERLFGLETLVAATGIGGREFVTFIAELGAEHADKPERYREVLSACEAAGRARLGRRELSVVLSVEIIKIFGHKTVAVPRPATFEHSLVILDDIFPLLQSGFRIAEYNAYLERYADAVVYSTGTALRIAHETRPLRRVVQDYETAFPAFTGRVRPVRPQGVPPARLYYTVFINNAHRFLPFVESTCTPFAFTLYPGGGLQLNDGECDMKLRRVFASPFFRRVIVTQAVTERYLLEKKFCPPETIRSIFGGPLPPSQTAGATPKRRYGVEKATLDVGFAANRYMAGGIDKGFDTFLTVARRLAAEFPAARFHVAGTLGAADGDITGLEDRITFHGCLPTDALHRLFGDIDLILSPNLPFKLRPGGFDGFPTGSCGEAGLCGVAVFCTDELKLNTAFKDGEEIVVLPRDPEKIFALVADYCRTPARLHTLAARGQQAFRRVFSLEEQMRPRFALLDELIAA